MKNLHGSPIWYELMTRDAAAAKRFYDAVVGWSVADTSMPGEVDYRLIESPSGNAGGVLTLTREMQDEGAHPCWLGYIGVDNVDATVEAVTSKGGSVLMPARDLEGVGRMAMVADPQGIPFYVMRGASNEPSRVFSTDTVGLCTWNELSTSDFQAALDFYTAVFGWEKGDAMDMGEMGEYRFLNLGGEMIGAIMQNPPNAGPAHWTYYFRVANIDAAHAAVTAGGGTSLHGPAEIPGGEFMVVVMDPDGAVFGVVGPR